MCNLVVIIPAYNAETYLYNAVESVLGQSDRNSRVIIVDDGSTDQTPALCDAIAAADSRVTVLHQENAGVACARNAGIAWALEHEENANGYIGFCDADDLWKAGCVTQQLLEDAAARNADIIGFSCWCTDQEAKRYYISNQYQNNIKDIPEKGTVEWLLNGPFCAHLYSMKMVRQFALRFPENVARNEDVIFMRQAVFCASRIIYREEILYLYRTNRNSVTHQSTDITKTMLNVCRAWHSVARWAEMLEVSSQKKESWHQLCMSTAAAVLLETARAMAESGHGPKHIFNTISQEPYYKAMDTLVVENLAYWQQPDLVLYRRNYKKFCRKYQLRGIVKKTAKLLLRIPFVRSRRDRVRFPISLEG